MAGKIVFDCIPAHRIIMVARRHRPNAMQVFRQQHKGIDGKRMSRFNGSERRTQQFDVVRFTKKFPPPESHDSEKISAAGSFSATILHNEDSQVGRVTAFPLPDILAPEMQRRWLNLKFVTPLKLGIVGPKQHARSTRLEASGRALLSVFRPVIIRGFYLWYWIKSRYKVGRQLFVTRHISTRSWNGGGQTRNPSPY